MGSHPPRAQAGGRRTRSRGCWQWSPGDRRAASVDPRRAACGRIGSGTNGRRQLRSQWRAPFRRRQTGEATNRDAGWARSGGRSRAGPKGSVRRRGSGPRPARRRQERCCQRGEAGRPSPRTVETAVAIDTDGCCRLTEEILSRGISRVRASPTCRGHRSTPQPGTPGPTQPASIEVRTRPLRVVCPQAHTYRRCARSRRSAPPETGRRGSRSRGVCARRDGMPSSA
jgi:hypothetical protein